MLGSRRNHENNVEVPEVVILRLPLYVRALTQLLRQGVEVVSSHHLGQSLQMTPAQIRKDLSYLGKFGKQGRGYNVHYLLGELKRILGLDREWQAVLVGVGRLGRAILGYSGFNPEGFRIVAAFDTDPDLIGRVIGGLKIQPMSELESAVRRRGIPIGIVAVPAASAQQVTNSLVRAGIRGVLNYAPVSPQVSNTVKVRNIDPVLSLQSMTYYLKGQGRTNG